MSLLPLGTFWHCRTMPEYAQLALSTSLSISIEMVYTFPFSLRASNISPLHKHSIYIIDVTWKQICNIRHDTMQHWYQGALAKGRTPLPGSSGARPWLSQEPTVSELEVSNQQERRSNGGGKPSTDTAVQINEPASTTTTAAVSHKVACWIQSILAWL